MIFVDSNVFMYAVGRPHALRTPAQSFFVEANRSGSPLCTSEEADVALARRLHEQYPALQARDLCHLAGCRRRGVKQIKTFDQTFAAVSGHQSIS